MMESKWLVAVGLAALVAQASGFQSEATSGRKHQVLRTVGFFAIGGVGYGGETSKGEVAYRAMLQHPQAVSRFQELLRDPRVLPAGKLYALLGLRSKSP